MAERSKNDLKGMMDHEFLSQMQEYIASSSKKQYENDKIYDPEGYYMHGSIYDNNLPIPPLAFIKKSLPIMQNFTTRDDDIFICAFPSSGTHWLWEMVCMLLNGKTEQLTGVKEQDMMELLMPEIFEKRQSPRTLNTHLKPKYLPEKMVKEGKIILVVRNPKDVVVSNYRQTFGLKMFGYEGSFPSFFEMFLEGKIHYGSWFDYMNDWMEVTENNPNLMLVTYEEAKKDMSAVLRRISKYLNLETSEDLITQIAEMCSFKSMKGLKEDATKHMDIWKKGYSLYRSGKVGTWKDWLTVQQNERMDEFIKTKLKSPEISKMYLTS